MVTLALVARHRHGRRSADSARARRGSTADLLDEGAGTRDAIELGGRAGANRQPSRGRRGPDATTLSHDDARALLAPRWICSPTSSRGRSSAKPTSARARAAAQPAPADQPDRRARLADRALLAARVRVASVRPRRASARPPRSRRSPPTSARLLDRIRSGRTGTTLIIAGDVTDEASVAGRPRVVRPTGPAARHPSPCRRAPPAPVAGRVLLVNRPGAPQSELRVGHLGPPRRTEAYHALVTLNAILGGQFTSRINRKLREAMGVTYGARSAFDFRARRRQLLRATPASMPPQPRRPSSRSWPSVRRSVRPRR